MDSFIQSGYDSKTSIGELRYLSLAHSSSLQ